MVIVHSNVELPGGNCGFFAAETVLDGALVSNYPSGAFVVQALWILRGHFPPGIPSGKLT